ncbi:acyl-CoA N-acyltransferase [Imleria badia]|nr:acyl-CoA N-acyltransferase [Imleria badia]
MLTSFSHYTMTPKCNVLSQTSPLYLAQHNIKRTSRSAQNNAHCSSRSFCNRRKSLWDNAASRFKNPRIGMVSLALHPRFWGAGYGTEVSRFVIGYAFKALRVQRVSLSVFEGNEAAIALYKRLGFKEEGRKRRCNWVEGHREDMIYLTTNGKR